MVKVTNEVTMWAPDGAVVIHFFSQAPAGQRFAAIGVGLGLDYPRTILLPEDTGAKQKKKLKK